MMKTIGDVGVGQGVSRVGICTRDVCKAYLILIYCVLRAIRAAIYFTPQKETETQKTNLWLPKGRGWEG